MVFNKIMDKRINILYYEPTSGYGGSSRCLLAWLNYLDKEKFNPFVIVRSDGPSIKNIRNLGIKIIKIPYVSLLKSLFPAKYKGKLISYIVLFEEIICNILPVSLIIALLAKRKKIDLIDMNASIINVVPSILASKFTRVPSVCHIHDTRKLTKIEKFLGKFVDKFIVLTNNALKLYSSDLGEEKLSLVYNGLNLNEWKPIDNTRDIVKQFNLSDEDFLVGLVGRIVEGKGHIDFIKTAKIISDFNRKVKFLIIGGSDSENIQFEIQLKDFVKNLGLEKYVIFTGWRNDVREVISNLDILVQASSTFPEGFGLTCIEAMALGKPVIATNIAGSSETILDGVTGFLISPGQPSILAQKILELINNPDLRYKMGKAGRERVEQLFNVVSQTKTIEQIYENVLKTSYT
jgi:glycosyltransferase involved in cell wall biosynthesis